MDTPSTQNATKSIRVSPEIHARLQKIVDTTGATSHNDAIALLMSPQTLRIPLSPQQHHRWTECARLNGQTIAEFIAARVEAAVLHGADPGALRRIHDMVYALTRAAGIVPQQSTPSAEKQVITGP